MVKQNSYTIDRFIYTFKLVGNLFKKIARYIFDVYQNDKYANKYLPVNQMDEVDEVAVLS